MAPDIFHTAVAEARSGASPTDGEANNGQVSHLRHSAIVQPSHSALAGSWESGSAPVAVVMITLNEAHNMEDVLTNLRGWAQEVHIVDSLSVDDTVGIALRHGAHVVQRRFRGFGDQWNFALTSLPIRAQWTMKLDPDERLSPALKRSIEELIYNRGQDAIEVCRRLWFMGKVLPAKQHLIRLWKTGTCRFTDVEVNEHPVVTGRVCRSAGYLEHHDSPDLDHWVVKQNRYTTTEAIAQTKKLPLSFSPRLLGTRSERRMWLKRHFWRFPGRFAALFFYHFVITGAWRAGRVGWIWARLRGDVYRMWEYKRFEIESLGRFPVRVPTHSGAQDARVRLYE
jgi:glycosyltransferase involved in cell wall biosynthesis